MQVMVRSDGPPEKLVQIVVVDQEFQVGVVAAARQRQQQRRRHRRGGQLAGHLDRLPPDHLAALPDHLGPARDGQVVGGITAQVGAREMDHLGQGLPAFQPPHAALVRHGRQAEQVVADIASC